MNFYLDRPPAYARWLSFVIILLFVSPTIAQDQPLVIGQIEFFGYSDLDFKSIKTGLPIQEGDVIASAELPGLKEKINQSIRSKVGRGITGLNMVCCDGHGNWMMFVGLPGATWESIPYRPSPRGAVRFSKRMIDLYDRAMTLTLESVQKQSAEDRTKGYSLSAYPPLREVQLSIRAFAHQHEPIIRSVLKNSADAPSRQSAAYALGYAQPSQRQISDLINASRDPDDIVRNNAVRALAVIASSSDARAASIPADLFVRMLKSGVWEDRNKALMLLGILTRRRQPALLRKIKYNSLDALIEMARWRDTGHALDARVILGRIAAIEETQLQKLAVDNPEEIITAVKKAP